MTMMTYIDNRDDNKDMMRLKCTFKMHIQNAQRVTMVARIG